MPKVSFILPAYKRRFLKESIDSILAQTCRDFELVIVDDKSPEGLYEVIKEYPWEKDFEVLPDGGRKWVVNSISVRYYQNEENMGGKDLVAAWNHATEYATGEWCVLASDDDVYHPEFLAEMLSLQVRYPQCDLFHCRIMIIGGDGDCKWIGRPRAEFENGIAMIYHATILRIDQRMPDLMFRKSALVKINGFPKNPTAWYSDLMFAVALAQEHGAVCSPRILFQFRESGDNITSRLDDVAVKIEAGLQFKDWIWRIIDESHPTSEEDKIFLEEVRRTEDRRIYDVMWTYLHKINFFKMLIILRRSRLSSQMKWHFIYKRLCLIRIVPSFMRMLFYPIVVATRPLRHPFS